MNNSIIVLLSPSCAGKDTTLNILKQKYPNLQGCVSHTTRPMRQTEEEGREYFFIDGAEFQAMYENGEFIETRSYNVAGGETWYYGMSEKEVSNRLAKGHVIMILDLQGLQELKEYYSNGEVDIHAFYIDVDEDTRIQRYLKRDHVTVDMVREMLRRVDSDKYDFIGVENHATIINNPPASDFSAYAIENYLVNRGIKLD